MRRSFIVGVVASLMPAFGVAQTVRGTVVDSASGKAVAGARLRVQGATVEAVADSQGRFTLTGVARGEQALTIHTASLDSMSASYSVGVAVSGATTTIAVRVPNALQIAASACGAKGYGTGGIVLGRLRIAGDSTSALSGTVSAEWPTSAAASGAAASGASPSKWISAMADARGRFALCGVPLDTTLTLRALTEGASGQSIGVRVSSSARFARTEIALHSEAATSATFAGVVTDSTNQPIVGAEVSMPDLSKTTLTNEQGAFVLRDIAPGSQRVVVRHLGYGPIETQVTFVPGRTTQRRIAMMRTTTLDSVIVTEKAVDHALDDFEANRKLGLGHFITRAELAKQEGRTTGAALTTVPGIKVFAIGPYAWVGSGRKNVTSLQNRPVRLDKTDSAKRAPLWDCYALVYLDDHLVFRGQKLNNEWEPLFDINSIPVSEIEAIEYYATAAETPAKYSTLNSQCGVLVIHTIRYHPRDTSSVAPKPR